MRIKTLRSKIIRIIPVIFIGIAAAVGIINTTGVLRTKQAEAATQYKTWNDCVNGSGAPNVESIQNACSYCWNQNDSYLARGTLWFNGSSSERNSDVIHVSDPEAKSVTAYMWGMVFSCLQYSSGSNTASYIWFAEPGQDRGNSITGSLPYAVDFIDGNNASKKLYRGTGSGQQYVWFSPQNNNTPITINLDKFKAYADSHGYCSGTKEDGYHCEARVSVNRCNNTRLGGYINPHSSGTCYGDDSKIVIDIDGTGTPPPEETEPEDAGQIRFYSQSSITTNANGDDIVPRTVSTRDNDQKHDDSVKDDKVVLRISTNQPTATVKFSHNVGFVLEDDNNQPITKISPKDRYKDGEDIYTDYLVNREDTNNRNVEGRLIASNPKRPIKLKGTIPQPVASNYTFNLEPGETKMVCEKTSYDPRIVKLKREEVTRKVPVLVPTSTDVGQGVFIVEFVDDPDQANAVVGDQLVRYRSANSSEYMHSAPVIKSNEWGQWVEYEDRPGGQTGMNIWSTNGETLYTFSFVGTDDFSQPLYADKYVYVPSMENSLYSYWYIGGDSPHHYNENGQLVGGVDPWGGWAVSSEGGSLYVREQRDIHDYWIYYKDYSYDTGSSEACIEITRPEPIKAEDPENGGDVGSQTGDGSNKPMYAGETTSMRWFWEVNAYPTRRVMEWQAVALQVKVNQNYDSIRNGSFGGNIVTDKESHEGYRTNQLDPCAWYRDSGRRLDLRENRCDGVDYDYWWATNGLQESYKASPQQFVAVPDEVGDKYCTASGLRWQYWYGIQYGFDENNTVWAEETLSPSSSYWTNYGMACSTIAKKPSVSIVNGGFFSNGGIKASIAPRFEEPLFARITGTWDTSNFSTTFGSWTEHLATINGSALKLGSGSSYAVKGASLSQLIKNSPLTIQNVNEQTIGYSGVGATSAVQARLASYFNSNSATDGYVLGGGASIGGSGWEGINDTRIVYVDGDVNITDNITLADNMVGTIYRLPQVVIYAKGNINISDTVTRIDAWLIAGGDEGKIDTCTAWVDKETSARIANYSGDDKIKCDKQLIVNGPVFAKKLSTTRAFGASRGLTNVDFDTNHTYTTDERANSGEIFNLGANTYLWAYAQAGRYNSSYTESYSRELPPRY